MPVSKNKHLFRGRYGHSATLHPNQRSIIVFGGSEDKRKNDLVSYDIATGSFSKVAVTND